LEAQVTAPLILTLQLDTEAQAHFERLRQRHYPAALNQIAAHLTLFHKLPDTREVAEAVEDAAARPGFAMRVTGLRALGRGVAYTLESTDLQVLHAGLAAEFADHLSAQDRQRFWPHVVVQNKATPEQARTLKAELEQAFRGFEVLATGLQLWRYVGGPWELRRSYPFSA
jgi:2'-5' RNA ligase